MMTPEQKTQWLELHIPSRFRAALAHTSKELAVNSVLDRYSEDAVQLRRLVALRWLIEFVGIKQDKNGNPAVCKPAYGDDINIEGLEGTLLPPSEYPTLARVWRATSKAVGHPTHGSGHDSLDLKVIVEAVAILKKHIQENLYKDMSLELQIGTPG